MAAPPEKTLKDLSGVWVLNKTLSNDLDPLLQLQGIGWFLRKAISLAAITLTITQYIDPDSGLTHIDTTQTATGGLATTELRALDWKLRPHKDNIFGELQAKTRWVELSQVDDEEFMKMGWDDLLGEHVQAWAESEGGGWTADQVWGFEIIDGKRYHTRRVAVRKGKDWKLARLVYDYQQ